MRQMPDTTRIAAISARAKRSRLGFLVSALAVLAFAPLARGGERINVDFGTAYGVPSPSYSAASLQYGTWNQAGLALGMPLVDTSGLPTPVTLSVGVSSAAGSSSVPTDDDGLLLNDNFYSTPGFGWSVDFFGLTPGDYQVYLYAPTNSVVSTGAMLVGGVPVASLPGDLGSKLIGGVSWVQVDVKIHDGSLSISGSSSGHSGLAGVQLAPVEPLAFNIDFGTAYGVPGSSWGAASGQVGHWNQVGTGSTLKSLSGGPSTVTAKVFYADSTTGSSGTPSTSSELLLNDNFYSLPNGSWTVNVGRLTPGDYVVYLYAPSNVSVSTGWVTVGSWPNNVWQNVPSLPGDPGGALIEGVSYARVEVKVEEWFGVSELEIQGSSSGYSGLAGIQIVPTDPSALNVDFGTAWGTPNPAYGAAEGQVGHWNLVGFNQVLLDLTGFPTAASVTVSATFTTGTTGAHNTDAELLLNDSFYSSPGIGWTAVVTGLTPGDYFVYLYAPSNIAVTTGAMIVGGVPVGSLPGDPGAALIEGVSWAKVLVTTTDGTLAATGSSSGYSGLAGIQVVPGPNFESYCFAGASASGCTATIAGVGLPSAKASSGFDLVSTGVEGAKDGLFFFGTNGRQANPWGNGSSLQCVKPPVVRAGLLSGSGTPGQCDGSFSQDLNALWCPTCPKPLKNPGAGAVVQAQLWYRDPFNTSNQTTSLSDAIEFLVGP